MPKFQSPICYEKLTLEFSAHTRSEVPVFSPDHVNDSHPKFCPEFKLGKLAVVLIVVDNALFFISLKNGLYYLNPEMALRKLARFRKSVILGVQSKTVLTSN